LLPNLDGKTPSLVATKDRFAPEAALGRLEIRFPLYAESRLNPEIAACPKSADFVAKVGCHGFGRWAFR
jgi:hypothetical protein